MVRLWTAADWGSAGFDEMVAELVAHNRRIADKREGWPAGALQMCEHLDAVNPGWTVWWHRESTIAGWEHPAGYVASRVSSGYVCGEDPAAVSWKMRHAPDNRHWHEHGACCDLRPQP